MIGCQESTARALLEEGVKWLNERGIRCEGALVFGNPFDHIPQTAQRIGADLIVLGYRPRSVFARWWSQSDEEILLARVKCSVLVAVSYTHLRAHETVLDLVCRLLLEKKNTYI